VVWAMRLSNGTAFSFSVGSFSRFVSDASCRSLLLNVQTRFASCAYFRGRQAR
jgi:hypothetical protein